MEKAKGRNMELFLLITGVPGHGQHMVQPRLFNCNVPFMLLNAVQYRAVLHIIR